MRTPIGVCIFPIVINLLEGTPGGVITYLFGKLPVGNYLGTPGGVSTYLFGKLPVGKYLVKFIAPGGVRRTSIFTYLILDPSARSEAAERP